MIEEIGKAATSVVDSLKGQPIMIALVVLQGFVLVAVLYSSINRQAAISKQFSHVYELLETCLRGNQPQQRGGFDGPRLQSDESRPATLTVPLPPPRPPEPQP